MAPKQKNNTSCFMKTFGRVASTVIANQIFHYTPVICRSVLREPASWSSGNVFVAGAVGRRFKSQAGQIGHSVANGSPPLQNFFVKSCVALEQNHGVGLR